MVWAALLLLSVCASVLASPRPTAGARDVEHPLITPAPSPRHWPPTKTYKNRRDILSDLTSDIGGILSDLGSDIPSFVASGVPNFFAGLPNGDDVKKTVGVNDDDLKATPTQVLNIPPYANWTKDGWNVRFHGNVFKQPNISQSKIDDLANKFLIDTSVQSLPPSQSAQAVNLTREIFVVQQDNQNVTFNLEPAPSAGGSGPNGGGGVPATGGVQQIKFPVPTTPEGDFDGFVPIQSNGLLPGNGTAEIQKLNVYTEGTDTGNATAYLVPTSGFTVISDIDDILRITKIYEPSQGLLNSFAKPYTPWMNMPSIYHNWSVSLPDLHFHYLTTTPEQVTRNYMQFIYATYPGGSFDTRPLNFSDVSATLSIRKFLLIKIFETFPRRKFILVADTSNSDVMRDYPEMATLFPGQVQCIFLRNTSSTDSGDKFPYDTSGFKDLNQNMYMFFKVPDDLTNLNIEGGQCYNTSIPQNLTFGYQGLPFGINTGSGSGKNGTGAAGHLTPGQSRVSIVVSGLLAIVGAFAFGAL